MSDPGDSCFCESCRCDGDGVSQIPYERLEEMLEEVKLIGYTITGTDHLDRAEQERLAGG